MKKKSGVLWIFFQFLLLLYGCPYESSFPLSPLSKANIDDELIGAWMIISEGEAKNGTALFYPISKNELIIAISEPKKEEGETVLFKAFVTTIRDSRFLNVQEIGPVLPKKWYIVNYTLSGDTLTTRTIQDNLFKDKKIVSPSELRKLIENNLTSGNLYSADSGAGQELVLRRIKKAN